MNPDEVDSQLSAMFDGELPAAECELLSRRIDRDENLRARWARYALIGASMRFEPVATASNHFAARVSSAMTALESAARPRPARRRALVWQTALAAALVSAVAGLSITMLRNAALNTVGDRTASSASVAGSALSGANRSAERALASAVFSSPSTFATPAAEQEPWSYVTPEHINTSAALRTELADYIVAHSEYSTPLMRSDLLSALISGEDGLESASSSAGAASASPSAGQSDAATAVSPERR